MSNDIYFVTDLQNAAQLTELLNNPESILTFNENNADISAKMKRPKSIKDLFRVKSKKHSKKNWPLSVEALRKVVLFSKQLKAHFEISLTGEGQWEVGNQIEEVYVRSLKTLRVLPWLQALYMPSKKKDKRKSLFGKPKPPLWAKPKKKDSKKSKEVAKEENTEKPADAPLADDVAHELVSQDADNAAPTPRVNVIGSANDLFGDDGSLRSPKTVSELKGPLLETVHEDHREAFPEGPPLSECMARFDAYQRGLFADDNANSNNAEAAPNSWSTWPPPKQRIRGDPMADQEAARAAALKQEAEAGGRRVMSSAMTMRPASKLTNKHEVTLRDIVGVDDDVLAWEAQRAGAAGDQAAKLNAAREDLELRVRQEAENEAAKREQAEKRREAAEKRREEEAFQAAIRAEQRRLQEESRARRRLETAAAQVAYAEARAHPHSQPAPRPPMSPDSSSDSDGDQPYIQSGMPVVYPSSIVVRGGGANAQHHSEGGSAPARPVYPSSVVRRGHGTSGGGGGAAAPAELTYHQKEAFAMRQREAMREAMRSQPGWSGKVQELAEFGGVSVVSAEAVLENFHGNLKAGKLYFLERMAM
eukprot:INCI3110.1.p1 GENE.INCI3110.1~~INCI3110.1.p1  ORF type:complete len:589 (-),score=120.29 INCI3110.1:272-2038(-)